MEFKPGDVVKLKSGGPKMTIEKIGPRSSDNTEVVASCVWFTANEELKDGRFPRETLKSTQEE
jgi:uncharacterized protein YodC (DUF2158 family)